MRQQTKTGMHSTIGIENIMLTFPPFLYYFVYINSHMFVLGIITLSRIFFKRDYRQNTLKVYDKL